MPDPLRVLLVAPADAAAAAVARLRAGGAVAPALAPSADLLRSALGAAAWDALLILPGSPVSVADIVAALREVPTAPLVAVEADRRPAALPEAILVAPGETQTLADHLVAAAAQAPPSAVGTPEPAPPAESLRPEPAAGTPPSAPESLSAGLDIGLYRTTPEGRILYANPAMARLLGAPSVDALELDAVLAALDYPREHFAASMAADGAVRNLILTWTHPSGRRIHTRETARKVTGADGAVLYFEGTMEDVTAEVETRRSDARRTRRHESIARFAGEALDAATAAELMRSASLAALGAMDADWSLVLRRGSGRNELAAWAGPLDPSVVDALEAAPEFDTFEPFASRRWVEDTDADAAFAAPGIQRFLTAAGAASLAVVPIQHGDATLASVVVGYAESRAFGSEDERAGEDLGWHVAGELVRQRAERDLADSEATLRYVTEHAEPVLFRLRYAGGFDYLSPGESRLGVSRDALHAAGGLDALADAVDVRSGESLLSPDTAGLGETLEVHYTLSDPPRTLACRARLWAAADGAPLGLVGHYELVHTPLPTLTEAAGDPVLGTLPVSDPAEPPAPGPAAQTFDAHLDRPGLGRPDSGEPSLVPDDVSAPVADGPAPAHTEQSLRVADLSAAASDAVATIQPLADAKGVGLEADVTPDLHVAAQAHLAAAVENLLRRAVKTTDEGTIRVEVLADDSGAVLRLTDRGGALSEIAREQQDERGSDDSALESAPRSAETDPTHRPFDAAGGTISVRERSPGTEISLHFERRPAPDTPRAVSHPVPMTHPTPLPPSGDGHPEAAAPPAHQGDGHAAFVARPQPPAGGMPQGFAPPQAPAPPHGAMPPAAPAQGYAAPPMAPPSAPPMAPPPAFAPAPQGFAPQQPVPAQSPQPGYAPPTAQHTEAPAPHGYAPPAQPLPSFAPPAPAPAAFAPAAAPPTPAPPAPEPAAFAAPTAPYVETPAPPATEAAPSPSADKRRILVVEDNNDTRMLLERILRRTYDVVAVGDARSALVAMHNTRFDGLVLDINLGGKETGADILRIARSLEGYHGVFAIALTAYALPGDRERLLEKGFSEYISKPFTRSSLMESLARGVGAPA